jgi:hypothetical protein
MGGGYKKGVVECVAPGYAATIAIVYFYRSDTPIVHAEFLEVVREELSAYDAKESWAEYTFLVRGRWTESIERARLRNPRGPYVPSTFGRWTGEVLIQ